MKHFLLLTLVFVAAVFEAQAQCTPKTDMTSYFEPEILADGVVGKPYSQVVYFKVPKDTVLIYNGLPVLVTVVNARILNMDGIPSGFTYQCNVSNCVFQGGKNGCAVITGTPTTPQIGTHPIKIQVRTIVNALGNYLVRLDSGQYDFKIYAPWPVGVSNPGADQFTLYPNPAADQLHINLGTLSANATMRVCNILGHVVYEKAIGRDQSGIQQQVNTASLPEGIYLLQLQSGSHTGTQRFVVRH